MTEYLKIIVLFTTPFIMGFRYYFTLNLISNKSLNSLLGIKEVLVLFSKMRMLHNIFLFFGVIAFKNKLEYDNKIRIMVNILSILIYPLFILSLIAIYFD